MDTAGPLLRLLQLLLLTCGAAAADPAVDDITEVIIYTKVAQPFSIALGEPVNGVYPQVTPTGTGFRQARGLTIDYIAGLEGVLAQIPVTVGNPPLRSLARVEMLEGNDEIFHQVGNTTFCNPVAHPERLCIGGAAISITTERETASSSEDPAMDFLPSYYMSGLKLMAKTDTSTSAVVKKVLAQGGAIFASLIIILASVIAVFAPIMWIFEAIFTPPHMVSIFHASDAVMMDMSEERFRGDFDPDDDVEISEARRFKAEMINAVMWTATLFTGGSPGKPASAPGKIVRAIGLALNRLLYVAIISAVTTVMTLGFQATGIKEYSELTGSSVCVNQGSTPAAYLHAHNVGFQVVELKGVEKMFTAFWYALPTTTVIWGSRGLKLRRSISLLFSTSQSFSIAPFVHTRRYSPLLPSVHEPTHRDEQCEAVAYDAPLLEYNLIDRKRKCGGEKSTCEANVRSFAGGVTSAHCHHSLPTARAPLCL